jgi:hypothetical protein
MTVAKRKTPSVQPEGWTTGRSDRRVTHPVALSIDNRPLATPPVCDVAAIFSHDTNLIPVVQTISRLKSAGAVETASWASESYSARLRIPGLRVFNHELDREVFDRVCDRTNYAPRR